MEDLFPVISCLFLLATLGMTFTSSFARKYTFCCGFFLSAFFAAYALGFLFWMLLVILFAAFYLTLIKMLLSKCQKNHPGLEVKRFRIFRG